MVTTYLRKKSEWTTYLYDCISRFLGKALKEQTTKCTIDAITKEKNAIIGINNLSKLLKTGKWKRN